MSKEHLQKISMENAPSFSTLKDRSLDPYSKWNDKINLTEDHVNGVNQTLGPIHKVDIDKTKDSTNELNNTFCSISCADTFLPVIGDQTLPYMLDDISLWHNSQIKILVKDSIIDDGSMIHNFVEDENENITNRYSSKQTDLQQEIALSNNETKTGNLDCIVTSNENYPDTPIPFYVLGKNGAESPIYKKNVYENRKSISPEGIYKRNLYFNSQLEKIGETLKIGDISLCKNYKQEESSAENQLTFQDLAKEPLADFGSQEIVYEGIGENFLNCGSLQDEVDQKPPVLLEVQSTLACFEENILDLFQECSPDEDGHVLKEALSEKLFSNKVFGSWILESWSYILKDAGPKISYERFHSTVLKLGEILLQDTNMKDIANEMLKSSSISNEPFHSLNHHENNEQFMPVFNNYKSSTDSIWECSEENRRSTLLPGHPNFLPNIKSEMSSFPSPIKHFMGLNSEKYLYKSDPLVLQNELFELTYANQKLTGEKDELAANLSKSEDEHNTLRDKISKLEAALNLVEHQALESQNYLRELNEVKLLLEIKNETTDKYLSELMQVKTEKQELENHIKNLKLKLSAKYELIDNGLKKEKEMCLKIKELTIDIIRMKDEKKKYCVMLENKDEEIDFLKVLCDYSQLDKVENNHIKNFEGRNVDVSIDAMLEDSCLEGIRNIKMNDKLQDNINPINIKDEIIFMDSCQDSLPFCEKIMEIGLSPERYEGVNLKDALDKWCFWNDKSIHLANACFEHGITSDSYELLLQHIRNVSFLIERWRNLLKSDDNFPSSTDPSTLGSKENGMNNFDISGDKATTKGQISLQNNIIPQSSNDISSYSSEDNNSENPNLQERLPEIFLRVEENINCLSSASSADQKDEIDSTSVCSYEDIPDARMALEEPTTDSTIAALERFIPNERRTNTSNIFGYVILLFFILIIWFMLLMKSASDVLWSPNPVYKSDELWQLVIASIPFVELRHIGYPPV